MFFLEEDNESPFPPTVGDVRSKVVQLIGTTRVFGDAPVAGPSGVGRTVRILPQAHPLFPEQLVAGVTVDPVEVEFQQVATLFADNREAPVPDGTVLWEAYKFTVTYTQRPFNVIRDDLITSTVISWFQEDGTETAVRVWPEWRRFCDSWAVPRTDALIAKVGQMRFRTAGPESATNPFNVKYPGKPVRFLPNEDVFVKWYAVPNRYIKSERSFIRKYRNYINQYPIDLDCGTFGHGELLYIGYDAERFTPPVAGLDPAFFEGVPAADKLCNITLKFISTTRAGSNLPADTVVDGKLFPSPLFALNKNWLMAGHNLLPWFQTRKYYYVTTDTGNDPKNWAPTFLSFPFQMLFKDPDTLLIE